MEIYKEDRIDGSPDMRAAIGTNPDGTPHYATDEKPVKGDRSISDQIRSDHPVVRTENVQPTKGMEATQDHLPHPWFRPENKTTE